MTDEQDAADSARRAWYDVLGVDPDDGREEIIAALQSMATEGEAWHEVVGVPLDASRTDIVEALQRASGQARDDIADDIAQVVQHQAAMLQPAAESGGGAQLSHEMKQLVRHEYGQESRSLRLTDALKKAVLVGSIGLIPLACLDVDLLGPPLVTSARAESPLSRCVSALPTVADLLKSFPARERDRLLSMPPQSPAESEVLPELRQLFASEDDLSKFDDDVTTDGFDASTGRVWCSVTRVTDTARYIEFAKRLVALIEKTRPGELAATQQLQIFILAAPQMLATGAIRPLARTRHRYIVQEASGGILVTVLNKDIQWR